MRLYDYILSGNCYKVRLLAAFLDLDYEVTPVDVYPGREQERDAFLTINPLGEIPVLVDGGVVLRDAHAILMYLATRFDSTRSWWPADDPRLVGQVAMWLAFAEKITVTSSTTRWYDTLGYDIDVDAARARSRGLFRILDDHLTDREFDGSDWLVGHKPTIADIACFPYTALAGDGGADLNLLPGTDRWVRRFMKLPGFIPMPGVAFVPG